MTKFKKVSVYAINHVVFLKTGLICDLCNRPMVTHSVVLIDRDRPVRLYHEECFNEIYSGKEKGIDDEKPPMFECKAIGEICDLLKDDEYLEGLKKLPPITLEYIADKLNSLVLNGYDRDKI